MVEERAVTAINGDDAVDEVLTMLLEYWMLMVRVRRMLADDMLEMLEK